MWLPRAGMHTSRSMAGVVRRLRRESSPSLLADWARYSRPSPLPQNTAGTGVRPRRVDRRASSPLRISRPFSLRMWGSSSHLARKMFSRLPSRSMWASPMLVMTPTSGRTMSPR